MKRRRHGTRWKDLNDRQHEGMTEKFWGELREDERQALVNENCIEEDCPNPRWEACGSFRCEEHTRAYSERVAKEAGLA